jgi:hypothetical protein
MFDYVDSIDLGFKLTELRFYDVMSTASNRFNPDFVFRIQNSDFDNFNVNPSGNK